MSRHRSGSGGNQLASSPNSDATRRRSIRQIVGALLAIVMVAATLWSVEQAKSTAATPFSQRLLAAWGLTTPEMVQSASAAGLNYVFLYGPPPDPSSPLGQSLLQANMQVISAEVADLVSAYECTRTQTVAPKPDESRAESYCASDRDYSESRLYEEVAALVERDRSNPLVAGYWVLDDTPDWDFGSLKPVLNEVASLIPAGRPKICGFSAGLGPNGKNYWEPGRAANFTAAGCDFVATYVYADSRHESDPPLTGIDWEMRGLLPEIKGSLQANGWDPSQQPLLGIAQAFGGRRAKNGAITDPPTPADMVAQARGYCSAGVGGLAWFAWSIATNYPTAQTPANDSDLANGVREAAKSCEVG
jgi:hypothetical protein